jgi:hypothetical protein
MSDADVLALTCSKEEVAFHEAGHAAIELMNGHTPQLILIHDAGPQWVGDCYSCAPTDRAHSGWRAQMAVAGALSQARFVAERHLQTEATLDLRSIGEKLVEFFLSAPRAEARCPVTWSDASGRSVAVDLVGGYSGPDHLHFRVEVTELAVAVSPGSTFAADGPTCQAAARDVVARCVATIADRFVWRQIRALAEELLNAAPTTVQMVARDKIEGAACMLYGYQPPEEP